MQSKPDVASRSAELVRILVLHWGQSGGGPRFAYEMARGLKDTGSVAVLLSVNANTELGPAWSEIDPHVSFISTYRSKLGVLTGVPRLLRHALALRCRIKAERVDVVYAPMFSIWQNFALPLILPRTVKYYASVHDAYAHPGDEKFVRRLCADIDRRLSDRLVTYSAAVAGIVRADPASSAKVVELAHGVSSSGRAARTPPPTNSRVVVGFFGRLVEYKGLDLFIKTISLVHLLHPNVQGEVWGSGAPRHLETLLRAAEYVDAHIEWVAEGDVETILDRFDILLLPYKEASQSGVLSLAAGLGIPTVVTPVGGLVEQAEAIGAVVADDLSASSLSKEVAALASDSHLYQSISATALASSQSLSWVRIAEQLLLQVVDDVKGESVVT